jgi:hypothetical protein
MYFFPTWFLSRVLLFSVSMGLLIGHGATIHIRVPRLIGKVHRIYDYLYFGDIGMVQKALAVQEISPVDVDEDGVSLLMVRSMYLVIVRLLIPLDCSAYRIKSQLPPAYFPVFEYRLRPHDTRCIWLVRDAS